MFVYLTLEITHVQQHRIKLCRLAFMSKSLTVSTWIRLTSSVILLVTFSDPTIIAKENMPESWENQIIEFATEALELRGVNQVSLWSILHSIKYTHICIWCDLFFSIQSTAEYVREKCQTIFQHRHWNCIVGQEFHAYAMSPYNHESDYASIEFSMGSINFSVFQSYY